jgi:hypothetical protein
MLTPSLWPGKPEKRQDKVENLRFAAMRAKNSFQTRAVAGVILQSLLHQVMMQGGGAKAPFEITERGALGGSWNFIEGPWTLIEGSI